jgi:uncharacterized protein (DUF488 family)
MSNGIVRLVDVRLNNVSQLAGFTKRDDLRYFLNVIADIDYCHELLLAPTADLLDAYRKQRIDWPTYEQRFIELMRERHVEDRLDRQRFAERTVLLCSEPTAVRCHRRLVVEYLGTKWPGVTATHL